MADWLFMAIMRVVDGWTVTPGPGGSSGFYTDPAELARHVEHWARERRAQEHGQMMVDAGPAGRVSGAMAGAEPAPGKPDGKPTPILGSKPERRA